MKKERITAQTVSTFRLDPDKNEGFVVDSEIPGLRLRMRRSNRAGGEEIHCVEWQRGKRGSRIQLGAGVPEEFKAIKDKKTGEIIQLGIRERAAQLNADFLAGKDVAADRKENRRRAANKIGDHLAAYLAEKKTGVRKDGSDALRPRSYAEVERHLMSHGKSLHALPLTSADLSVAVDLLDRITRESGATASDRVRTSWGGFYGEMIRKGLVPVGHNPFAATAKNGTKPRERAPDDGELAEIWRAAADDQFGSIVKLLMLTLCRRDEIADLRRAEIVQIEVPKARRDGIELAAFTIDTIDLPPARMGKSKRRHIVPLSAPALAVLHRQPQRVGDSGELRDLVFGFGQGGFSGWSKSKACLDERICKARVKAWKDAGSKGPEPGPMPGWTLHDFRRSADTILGDRFGVPPHVTSALLAHTSSDRSGKGGSDRAYNYATYLRERVEALQIWADHIMSLVGE